LKRAHGGGKKKKTYPAPGAASAGEKMPKSKGAIVNLITGVRTVSERGGTRGKGRIHHLRLLIRTSWT